MTHQTLEYELILAILKNDPIEIQRSLINPAMDWQRVYQLLLRHRVWHQARIAFAQQEMSPKIPIADRLARYCKKNSLHILKTAAETTRLAREWSSCSIEHCFIKGTLLNVHLYGALDTRPCRDIDVWVHPTKYKAASERLIAMGYKQKLPSYELTGFKERYYLSHRHDIAFYHAKKGILVELHFRLDFLGTNFFTPTPALMQSIQLLDTPVQTLADNYHLLYLMVHGAIHAWIRLRWLNDIALYIKSDRCDLNHVMTLAEQIQSVYVVEQSLILVRDILGIDSPVMNRLLQNPCRRAVRLANLSKQFIAGDYEMTDGIRNIKFFLKYRVYIMMLAVPKQKIRAVLGDLLKIDEVFPYVTFKNQLSWLYYLVYPLWVMKYIINRWRVIG